MDAASVESGKSPPDDLKQLRVTSSQDFEEADQYMWNTNAVIGGGAFGKVYKGWHKVTYEKVAVKVIPREFYAKDRKFVERETDIQMDMRDCENIVRLFARTSALDGCALIMERCDKDLEMYVTECRGLDEAQIKDFLLQLNNGLKKLCEKGVVHRDLKPANILLKQVDGDQPGSSRMIVKLGDFGGAREYRTADQMTTMVGTPIYMAPEALENYQTSLKGYDEKVDMWSVGAVLYFCVTTKHGFLATEMEILSILKNKGDAIAFTGSGQLVEYYTQFPVTTGAICRLSGDFKEKMETLIRKLLVIDPSRRMDYQQFSHNVRRLCGKDAVHDSTRPDDHPASPDGLATTEVYKLNPLFAGDQENRRRLDKTYKLVLLGNVSVGKTSLVTRLTTGKSTRNTKATIAVDYKEAHFPVDDLLIPVQLWDTAGQERHKGSLTNHVYRDAHGLVIVYDICSKESYDAVKTWHSLAKNSMDNDTIFTLICGNKIDCRSRDSSLVPVVTTEEGAALANDCGAQFGEVSAETNANVSEVFLEFIRNVYRRDSDERANPNDSIKVSTQTPETERRCPKC
ncbi:uncharacterized protein LOC134181087 [Corticium candelabrum]|uniref:uncharacterized protein LOC134181087 n=1 Tax=Corticium candelabrum TaxID=121492 RepID=UPI002E26D587|nr:uncharacterized protein LOC134181087 [Corticium candelabrum]